MSRPETTFLSEQRLAAPRVVAITGNLTRPSRTRTLATAVLAEVAARQLATTELLDIVDAGPELGTTLAEDQAPPRVARVLSAIRSADVLVVASPVYKASYTGLFKHLFDLLDQKALEGRPVLLAATGGSDRHALVIEHQLRPLLSFFNALTLPVSLYAANGDFAAPDEVAAGLHARISRCVDQIVALPIFAARGAATMTSAERARVAV